MTDRELLELAAKAAGIEVFFDQDGDCYRVRASLDPAYWNPILFDGDALRLAVALRLELEFGADFVSVGRSYENDGEWHLVTEFGDDPLAATRRAIVRAAAETGRTMP